MWTIIKFEKSKFEFLRNDLEKLGKDCIFYKPKISTKRLLKKLVKKEFSLLGDYLFCFNPKFEDQKFIKILNYTRG